MSNLSYHPADSALAARIQADIAALDPPPNTLILIHSAQSAADPEIQRGLVTAVEQDQHIIPVLAEALPLPRLIEQLDPVDFSEGYDFEQLAVHLAVDPAEMPMKVRTPDVIAANRRLGLVVTLVVLVVFVVSLYAVAVLGIMAPVEEYDQVETEVIETRNAIIDEALPRSTEGAQNFQATLEQAAPTLRPILAATASAQP